MDLASVQRIKKIEPIEGADLIEKATVLGWQVVVKKGEFKVGDLCVYIQIDTVVPDKPEFEFLKERNFRIRTIKLRGCISQGILFPITYVSFFSQREGADVTDEIGVKKYEKPDNNPIQEERPRMPKLWYKKWVYLFKYNFLYKWFPSLKRKTRSPFPRLVPITDETRIQNIPDILETHKGKKFVVSYKLDGSSITIIHNKVMGVSKYRICSRKFELHDNKNDWHRVFKETSFEEQILKLVNYYKTNDIIVQGEAIGKFNGNYHQLKSDEIKLFNIYVNGKRVNQEEFIAVCCKLLIPHCPAYSFVTLNHTMEEIIKYSEIKDYINSKVDAEGLVWRCIEDNRSFKVINNKYLLANKE